MYVALVSIYHPNGLHISRMLDLGNDEAFAKQLATTAMMRAHLKQYEVQTVGGSLLRIPSSILDASIIEVGTLEER